MVSPYDLVGLAGVSLSMGCYARVQWQRDYAKKLSYSLLNLMSAALLAVSLDSQWNLAAFIGNLVWGSISAYGVYRCMRYIARQHKSGHTNKL